ncbi:MAG: Uma2 family endonuclease [Stenomitos frigidus ULC029]
MLLLDDLSQWLELDDPEERRVITNVPWSQYEALLTRMGDSLAYRINYLDGVLEIVAPSRRHESGKTRIGTLLEIYFLETDTEYFPTGSTAFRNADKRVGTEPDESYCIGTDKAVPDLAIELCSHYVNEVVVTSGNLNRLERFQRLGVQEVWFWQNNCFLLYHLREENLDQWAQTFGYEAIGQSELLPNPDMTLLSDCVQNPNPLAAAKAFRQGIRDRQCP